MRKIGLDISALDSSFKEHSIRGIGRYVQELKNYFDTQSEVSYFDHKTLLSDSKISKIIDCLPLGKLTLKQQLLYPFKTESKLKEFDIIHFPAHMDVPSWSRKKYIITVLDLIPLIFKDLYKPKKMSWRFKFARFLEIKAIKNAEAVIAISENTANDVNRILGIPREKIFVTPLGVDESFFNIDQDFDRNDFKISLNLPLDKKIILYVGGIDARKNYPGLIKTFSKLKESYKEKGLDLPILVMAGKIKQDKNYPDLIKLIQEYNLEENIKFTGYVSDEDLLKLYEISSVFCFLSLYEGFGLTPLEAMATKTPVVSSNTSAMPEVLGDAALLVSPTDEVQSAKALFQVLNDKELSKELVEKGYQRAKNFSWQKTGKLTLKAYHSINKEK